MVFGSCFEEEQMGFAHQEEMIKQFQALLEEVDENLKESFKKFYQGNPTETLICLLKASNWNVQRAHKVLLDCLQWIVHNNFVNILEKPVFSTDRLFRAVGDSEIVGFSGYSKEGLVQVTNENCQLPRDHEYVVVGEGVKCIACIRAEDLLGEKMKGMKNKFRKSDFQSFPQGWKACDGNNVPPYLEYVHEAMGGNITATATLLSKDIIAHTRAYVYAAIDEMHNMQLVDITDENVILKWGCVIRDAKKMDFDVEFVEEHLKKIAHAYFKSKGRAAESNKEEHVICSSSDSESFEDGAPLSKGLLLFA